MRKPIGGDTDKRTVYGIIQPHKMYGNRQPKRHKKKFWLLLIMVVTMAVAYLLAARYDNLYQSVTKIATGFTVTNQLDPDDRIRGLYETNIKFNNLIENINSPIVVNQVAYRLMIHDLSEKEPFRQPLNSKCEPF